MSLHTAGTNGDDILFGQDIFLPRHTDITGGHDRIDGKGGNDFLSGGLSRDNLTGGLGNDTLVSGAGDDFLTGDKQYNLPRTGHDKHPLPTGKDIFIFSAGDGHDLITDFHIGEDKLVFGVPEANLIFTVTFQHPDHWGMSHLGIKHNNNIPFTIITNGDDTVTLVGITVHSLADLNG